MAEQEGKKDEEKVEFDSAGEALGYISLDQAQVLAMRTARDEPGDYGADFRDLRMAFEVAEASETEDHYIVTLSFRPEGRFAGSPGEEQFYVEKEGSVVHRQVLSLPEVAKETTIPIMPIGIGLVGIAIAAAVGILLTRGEEPDPSAGIVPAVAAPTAIRLTGPTAPSSPSPSTTPAVAVPVAAAIVLSVRDPEVAGLRVSINGAVNGEPGVVSRVN